MGLNSVVITGKPATMRQPPSALAVANYFIDLGKKESKPDVSPMKLQKLLYFAHGWNLAIYGEDLINEDPQAWEYGPVFPSVYHEFKKYGSKPIDSHGTDLDFDHEEVIVPRVPMDDSRTLALLNKIWAVYGKYSGVQLSNLIHAEPSAWSKTREENPGKRYVAISRDLIKEDFFHKAASNGQKQIQP